MSKNRDNQFLKRMEPVVGIHEAPQLIASLGTKSPKSVRFNRKRSPLPEEELNATGAAVPWCRPFGRYWERNSLPASTIDYCTGNYYIQESSAMLAISAASQVFDFSDKIVLDLTAAPGGKATQTAELIGSGFLVANEVIRKRVDALIWNINRHRLNNVIITSMATGALADSLPEFFDAVIVDAPCSGEGLIQKRKHSLVNWSEKNVRFCARRQTSILEDALRLVKPGGTIIYSTCTFAPEENEAQIEKLLTMGTQPVPLPENLPVSPAVSSSELVTACSRRIFPHREGGAGAFVSVVQKKSGPSADASTPWSFKKNNSQAQLINILKKSPLPLEVPENQTGFFFETSGIVSYFSHERVPSVLLENNFQLGAPVYDKRRPHLPMFGGIQLASPSAAVELTEEEAIHFCRGGELQLDRPDGFYWAAYTGTILGPLHITAGRAVNHLPRPLQNRH
jgi:16S rRNA C967 or C1407 C5-methylase (RsmB/RsmF family)